MKQIWIAIIVGLACCGLSLCTYADDVSDHTRGAGVAESVAFARVAMNAEGQTYFADAEAKFELKDFAPPARPVGVAAMQPAKTVVFTTADGDWHGDWHPTPRRQFVFMLGGAIEIEVADGEIRRFSIGDIILLEDVSGKGHDTRVVSVDPALFAIVALPKTP